MTTPRPCPVRLPNSVRHGQRPSRPCSRSSVLVLLRSWLSAVGVVALMRTVPRRTSSALAVLGVLCRVRCEHERRTCRTIRAERELHARHRVHRRLPTTDAQFLGPLLVGMAAGLYLPARHRARVAQSCCSTSEVSGLSAVRCRGGLLHRAVQCARLSRRCSLQQRSQRRLPTRSSTSCSCCVQLSLARRSSASRRVADELWLGDLQIYPFALIGVLLGRLYVDLGAWVIPLFVAPILIARQAFASYLAPRAAQEGILDTLIHALGGKGPLHGRPCRSGSRGTRG